MDKMHSLLRRQLKKIFGSADNVPKDLQEILGVINEAYFNFDADRLMLERSIEISSHELVEANSQMRSIFQVLPDMFLKIDANGKIIECKIPTNNTSGHIQSNEIVGESIYTIFGPMAARQLEWAVRRAVKNKTVEIAEYSVQNQAEQFHEARVVWLNDEQLIVIVRDITERKLAENRLFESQRMLQTLLGNLPGMAYRCRNDHGWTMEFISEGCVNLTGYKPSELINNSKITYNQLIHPDDCEKVWDAIQAALKERKTFHVTYRIKTVDGGQKWVFGQGQGIFTSKDELTAIEGFISDATDKVQMQESIKENESFLSAVFASIQDGISVLDANLNIVRTNPAMEKWYAHAMPLIGKKCYEIYHGRKTYCDACPACRTLETGKAEYGLVPKTGPDGKVTGWIDVYSFPLVDAATGKLKGVIEYVRKIDDASEHRAIEKKLAESPGESADNEVPAAVTTSATEI